MPCCSASGVLDYCVIAFYLRMTLTHRELLNIVRATYSFTHPLTYTRRFASPLHSLLFSKLESTFLPTTH